jgi:hypothetical protein
MTIWEHSRTYRATNRFGFRYSNQQGCGSADSRRSLPTRAGLGWSFIAHFPRSHEGQSLEPRPLSMLIRNLADTLGLVVMDQFTRRIVGFGAHGGIVNGVALCRMFNRAIRGQSLPKYLSSDHDPLYRFHQWQANLRVLEVTEIKTVPYVPLSHPFVERLIGTVRREYLDRILFWTTTDLEDEATRFPTLL